MRDPTHLFSVSLLTGVTAWAIYFVSPIGIVLPAAIAMLATDGTSEKRSLRTATLAYALGISAIILADSITEWFLDDPFWVTDDYLRTKVLRIWAGCGILGALCGASLSTYFGSAPSG